MSRCGRDGFPGSRRRGFRQSPAAHPARCRGFRGRGARTAIGRDLRPVRGKQRVGRAEPEERGTAQGRIAGGTAGIRVCADAEIARRAQAVELGGESPIAGAILGIGARAPAPLRRRDDPGLGPAVADRGGEPVITRRQRRQVEPCAVLRCRQRGTALAGPVVLVHQPPRDGAGCHAHPYRHAHAAPCLGRQKRRDHVGAHRLDGGEAAADRFIVRCCKSEGFEHAAAYIKRRIDPLPESIGEAVGDADEVGEAFEITHVRGTHVREVHLVPPIRKTPVQDGSCNACRTAPLDQITWPPSASAENSASPTLAMKRSQPSA